ncbi:hypothetical protein B0F90DRAFT_628853 [Multifurca ochricompacta]|uniref:Uncharacterized protein n=1 Tax=Multifurca ochricompacta TaxID=376703 RepID=A0AAD4LUQ5_9AGAM|nr:hypothetical protein B0F90DRAFT_628853 [Multifurca ochricompacta]
MVPIVCSTLFVTCSNIPLERSVGASPNSRVHEEVARQERQRASESIPGHGVISMDTGFQAPEVAVNSMAQRRPRFKFPSVIHSAKALEYMLEPDNLTEVGSGTILALGTVQAVQVPSAELSTPVRKTLVDREWAEYICEECTKLQGHVVSFNCRKDLNRHRSTTKVHKESAVAISSCGRTIMRKDGIKLHLQHCNRQGIVWQQDNSKKKCKRRSEEGE